MIKITNYRFRAKPDFKKMETTPDKISSLILPDDGEYVYGSFYIDESAREDFSGNLDKAPFYLGIAEKHGLSYLPVMKNTLEKNYKFWSECSDYRSFFKK